MNHIRIKTISVETKIIYALWTAVFVSVVAYVFLIGATMVYGVEKRTLHARVQQIQRARAVAEAELLLTASAATESDALERGLVRIASSALIHDSVRLGRSE